MNIEGVEQRAGALPVVGHDTDAILAEAGYSADEVAELHASGALGG
jgi:crotonobetainyl-CoA:carnitine CoA-transferase CaiB-like acyl-CoA transferase